MIVEIVEISAIQKKSEYASICLYFSIILFDLCHILLFLFDDANIRIISDITEKVTIIISPIGL
jgi:hypothetical protein